jgi:hypothetical protein
MIFPLHPLDLQPQGFSQRNGPDITLQFYDLKGMTDEEKENLKIFLQGLKAWGEQGKQKK